ncbi:lachesin isoform X2 [Episyrphus balteatus]|nr:lachesin isoform X2 [Episyrphus balteatus]XP_055837592.1 lachesin isoform X2 [Episyrphus balteatus]
MGFLKYTFALQIMLLLESNFFVCGQNNANGAEPEFLSEMFNITVPQGRDVSFICIVNNLAQYRVAWIKSDSKAILGIHTHMVSLNPRLSVTHNGHNTWKLLITHVQLNDSGSYMCQLNTDPMKSLSAYLEVVVPPDILNQPGPEDTFLGISNEGGTIQLVCNATGVPEPTVVWRREGGKNIVLRSENKEKRVLKSVEGASLTLTNVQRTDMGGYLCIASNGVPPSVSKRFDVYVHFPPSIKTLNQLVAAPIGSQVTLECFSEVFPKPLNGWYKDQELLKDTDSHKYNVSEVMINPYTWQMNLTIYQLTKADFGPYICSSVNALGKNEARIRFQELRLPKPKTTTVTKVTSTVKTIRKQNLSYNKDINEVFRPKHINVINYVLENNTDESFNNEGAVSQISTVYEHENTRNSHSSAIVPSSRSPRLISNGTKGQRVNAFLTIYVHFYFIFIFLFFLFD